MTTVSKIRISCNAEHMGKSICCHLKKSRKLSRKTTSNFPSRSTRKSIRSYKDTKTTRDICISSFCRIKNLKLTQILCYNSRVRSPNSNLCQVFHNILLMNSSRAMKDIRTRLNKATSSLFRN